MTEFRFPLYYKIFICIVAVALVCFFYFVFKMLLEKPNETDWNIFNIVLGVSIFLAITLVIEIFNAFTAKFAISKDRITVARNFSEKQLLYKEIVGFRIREQYIFFESKNCKSRIKISSLFDNYKEILDWASKNFQNLDIADAAEENKKILSDVDYGWTVVERNNNLKRAKKVAVALNITGIWLLIWLVAYPKPYELVIISSILFPILCLIILKYFKGLLLFDARTKSGHPTIMLSIISPSVGLLIRTLQDYKIFNYSNVWIPSLLIAATYVVILIIDDKTLKNDKAKQYFTLFTYCVAMFAYSFSTVVIINCLYDRSIPNLFTSTITDKKFIQGYSSSSTYSVKLTSWGEQKEAKEVSVTKDEFKNMEINDQVSILYKKGLFDISWYEIKFKSSK
ncbi:hypothetical protein [Flavobacterium ardleyense]|uniref:hypothetical protein n=1 Tax=Flavobacterium ardleyense TaxID=2038737 RepID=UPI00298D2872|nr:hypothetical protein [Flavobacterium ardleyense]